MEAEKREIRTRKIKGEKGRVHFRQGREGKGGNQEREMREKEGKGR